MVRYQAWVLNIFNPYPGFMKPYANGKRKQNKQHKSVTETEAEPRETGLFLSIWMHMGKCI